MTESLLSFSEVLLFGRELEDIEVIGSKKDMPKAEFGSDGDEPSLEGTVLSNQNVAVGNQILLIKQADESENGLYTVSTAAGNPWVDQQKYPKKTVVKVTDGNQKGFWKQKNKLATGIQEYKKVSRKKALGDNSHLEKQLGNDAQFARIYGFSYEGTYYELPEPTIFLVHGEGEDANAATANPYARAPLNPSKSGVAAAEYQVADGIKVWAYDKADYTMRMDVMSGMFEQVLLDIYFGFDSPAISGAKVSGAKVSGAKVSGAKVSGAKVSGAKARGSGD